MPTFKICIFEHQKRDDGKYPVSIRVYHRRKTEKKGQYAYINTSLYVSEKQALRKVSFNKERKKEITLSIKDPFVVKECNSRILKYENLVSQKLGLNIELYSTKELAGYFIREGVPGSDSSIDFIEFSRKHFDQLVKKGKKSTAIRHRQTINAMIDFCSGRRKISITEINVKFLNQFEEFLRGKRILKRVNQLGNIVTTEKAGLSDISIMDYMTDVRTLFNAAIDEYNDEDRGDIRVKHYPFRKYKLKKGPEPEKRVLTTDQVRAIRDCNPGTLRSILAKDVFLLSFYLAGINTADLYDVKKSAYKNGRLSYYRQKTRDRRQDKAYISIKIFPEALPLFKKYVDKKGLRVFNFANSYADFHTFNSNINIGLKKVATICKIDRLSTYHARFSFASIARNDCNVSKDDIGLALNHVDGKLKVTDIYIQKDWSNVDNAIRKVIDHLNNKKAPF